MLGRGLFSLLLSLVLAGVMFIPSGARDQSSSGAVVDANSTTVQLVADKYPWPHNGCTSAPDKAGGVNFTHPCNQHDGCSARHWADRATCDRWFRNDLEAECNKLPLWVRTSTRCIIIAGTYYGAVRTFGARFYYSGGEYVRINTPMSYG